MILKNNMLLLKKKDLDLNLLDLLTHISMLSQLLKITNKIIYKRKFSK